MLTGENLEKTMRIAGNCQRCGTFRRSLDRDHIIPRWAGGTDDSNNLQYLCRNCHQDKTLDEYESREYREHKCKRRLTDDEFDRVDLQYVSSRAYGPGTMSEKTKLKIGRSNTGKVRSDESKQKTSRSMVESHRKRRELEI